MSRFKSAALFFMMFLGPLLIGFAAGTYYAYRQDDEALARAVESVRG